MHRPSVLLVAIGHVAVAVWGTTAASSSSSSWESMKQSGIFKGYPSVFQNEPPASPPYMVDNEDNLSGKAPINGKINGPKWAHSNSFKGYMDKLGSGKITGQPVFVNTTNSTAHGNNYHPKLKAAAGDYWLPTLAPLGKQPLAGGGYTFYRDVTTYGASPNGDVDATEAINAAIEDGNRCGLECGNSFALGAIIYFPPGTYLVCSPIVQLYYTQFISDPHNRAIIKGCPTFTGIALVDTDPYIPHEANPDGSGVNWYVNQNNFFRQIRNMVFDLTDMPSATDDAGQPLVPTGIHWQVAQGTSLQNLLFKMPEAGGKNTTHVGIFTENGSGGFVSDLEFQGGAIGWRAGSQQYTARGLQFTNCITAVQMVWDWGFNWQDITINGGTIGFNISGHGGLTGQGIGSISLIDSSINNVPIGILTNGASSGSPNIVIENTDFNGVNAPVQADGGATVLAGSQHVDLWALGRRYTGGQGSYQAGAVTGRPTKPAGLLDGSGKMFTRSRPQYESLGAGSFLVATTDGGCSSDGTGDQTACLNSFFQSAAGSGKIAYLPAGIYSVQGTVTIPVNSKVQGASWSQIQATGSYFQDMTDPHVVVKVGNDGDVGTMEIVEVIFSAKGPTAGAIMVEWNVHESSQGAAGMWDSHIRVGGALGSDLDQANCPKLAGLNDACITASLLLHVTSKSSGYFENVWAWVADHDNDFSLYWEFDPLVSQISLYGARGMLIESQGPCWFYGTASEHTVLYQYQLQGAKDIYLGHIQTETPYFQPVPTAPTPFEKSVALNRFAGDPTFADCTSDSCKEAWGLRIIDSSDITIHSAGLYSWFVNYGQDCLEPEDCQERIAEVDGSTSVVIFNLFTKGVTQIGTGSSNSSSIQQADDGVQPSDSYTTEVSVWFPTDGGDNIVYVGPEVYTSHTVVCSAPCTLVMPPSSLGSTTTITLPTYKTSLEVGSSTVVNGQSTFVVTTTTITITLGTIVTDSFPMSNVNVTAGQTGGGFNPSPSVPLTPVGVPVTNGNGGRTTRTVTLPPWPDVTRGPPDSWPSSSGPWGGSGGGGGGGSSGQLGNPFPFSVPVTGPVTTTITWPAPAPTTVSCPPSTVVFHTPSTTLTLSSCPSGGSPLTVSWQCPSATTVTLTAKTTTTYTASCTPYTVGTGGGGSTSGGGSTTFSPWVDPPYTRPPIIMPCPPNTLYIQEKSARITVDNCNGATTLDWDCPPTKTVGIDAKTDTSFSLGCTVWTGTGTSTPLPVYTTWPPGALEWTDDDVEGSDNKKRSTCKLWFFHICLVWGKIKIGGWTWDFPPGILPPGPPPTIKWPPGVTITGNLPGPWPRITIGNDGVPTYPTEQPTDCTSSTADICSTTTSFTTSSVGRSSTRTITNVISTCTTIFGCDVEDEDGTTSRTTGSSCTRPTGAVARRDSAPTVAAQATGAAIDPYHETPSHVIAARANLDDYIIYPADSHDDSGDAEEIQDFLTAPDGLGKCPSDFVRVQGGGLTAFFFVEKLSPADAQRASDALYGYSVSAIYPIHEWNEDHEYPGVNPDAPAGTKRGIDASVESSALNNSSALSARDDKSSSYWELSQLSVAPGENWRTMASLPNGPFQERYDNSFGRGQTIYVVEDAWDNTHSELAANGRTAPRDTTMRAYVYGQDGIHNGAPLRRHGTEVLSNVWGVQLGLARNAQIVVPSNTNADPTDRNNKIQERYLESLVRVLDEVKNGYPGNKGTIIINMSFGWLESASDYINPQHFNKLYEILDELDQLGAVLVAASHNFYQTIVKDKLNGWPSRFGDPGATSQKIPNLIVVSGTDLNTVPSPLNPYASWLAMAPGYKVHVASPGAGIGIDSGASLAAPRGAAVIAYWRGLQGVKASWKEELKDPAIVKTLVRFMHRPITLTPDDEIPVDWEGMQRNTANTRVPFLWTGRVKDGDCLVDPSLKGCPTFTDRLADLPAFGSGNCAPGAGSGRVKRQSTGGGDAGAACVFAPGGGAGGHGAGGSGGGGGGSGGSVITYKPGPTPSPTCTGGSGVCGTLCTGYYCVPHPTGQPPDFGDPQNPSRTSGSGGGGSLTDLPTLTPPASVSCTAGQVKTTTEVCVGNGGHTACVTSDICTSLSLPPLSSSSCPRSWSSTTICVGEGGHTACVPSSVCPPPSSIPTVTPSVTCSNPSAICLGTTSYVLCARDFPTASATPAPTPANHAAPATTAQRDKTMITAAPAVPKAVEQQPKRDDEVSVKTRREYALRVDPRQDDGCQTFYSCKLCAIPTKMPCLDISIIGTGDFFYNIWEGHIKEDGNTVCSTNFDCDNCQGLDDWADCGGGNKWKFTDNAVWYHSNKYGQDYNYYLDEVKTETYGCGIVVPVFDCTRHYFSATEGPCRNNKRDAMIATAHANVNATAIDTLPGIVTMTTSGRRRGE